MMQPAQHRYRDDPARLRRLDSKQNPSHGSL
jgi:hypothetical protein